MILGNNNLRKFQNLVKAEFQKKRLTHIFMINKMKYKIFSNHN